MQIRWLLKIIGGVIAALVLALAIWALVPPFTPTIPGTHAIAELRSIELGGFPQIVLLRGVDRRNPLLLYVHGGPGSAHIAIAREYSDQLEQHFVVAHWDQRGSGASCADVDWSTLSLERIVADTIELVEKLGGGQKVFLVGHSWGSLVGVLAVRARPDLFHAYVGLGQLVNRDAQERISYDWVLGQARTAKDAEAIAELETIAPPYSSQREFALQRRWLSHFGGDVYAREKADRIWPWAAFAPEYRLSTKLSYGSCFDQSLEALFEDRVGVKLDAEISKFAVPVYFLLGRKDFNTPSSLVEAWARHIEAPKVETIWFEDAGHMIPLEATQRFQSVLIEKLLPYTK